METPKHPNTQVPNLTPEQLAELKGAAEQLEHLRDWHNPATIGQAFHESSGITGCLTEIIAGLPQLLAAAERAMMETPKHPIPLRAGQIPNLTPERWRKALRDFEDRTVDALDITPRDIGQLLAATPYPPIVRQFIDDHHNPIVAGLRADVKEFMTQAARLLTERDFARAENSRLRAAIRKMLHTWDSALGIQQLCCFKESIDGLRAAIDPLADTDIEHPASPPNRPDAQTDKEVPYQPSNM